MASIATLTIDLFANVAKLQTDMQKATNILGDFQRSVNKTAAIARNAFSGLGIGLGVTAMAELIKSSAEAADQLSAAANAIGISTDELQRYRYAADQSGVSTEAMNGALEKATKSIGEARVGTGSLTSFLEKYDKQLLTNIRNAGSMDEALKLIFDGISNAKTSMDKAALSAAAFGRTVGVEMVNLVGESTKSLNAMKAQADAVGAVLDNKSVNALNDVNDKFGEMAMVVKTQLSTALVSLKPLLIGTADWIEEIANRVGRFTSEFKSLQNQDSIHALQQQLDELTASRQASIDRLSGKGFFSFLIPSAADRAVLPVLDKQISAIQARIASLQNMTGIVNRKNIIGLDPKAVEEAQKQIDAFTKSLRNQAETFGLSSAMALKYRIVNGDIADQLKILGKAGDQDRITLLDYADALQAAAVEQQQLVETAKQHDEAMKEGLQLMESVQTPTETYTQQLMHMEELLANGAIDAQTFYRGWTKAQQDFTTNQTEFLRKNHDFAQQFIDAWDNAAAGFTKGIGDAFAKAVIDQQKFADVGRAAIRAFASEMISAMVAIEATKAAHWAIDQARLLWTTKAAAPAAAEMSLATAGTNAIPAMAGMAATFSMARAFSGMAHDGLPSVPETGTYLLQKGERVVKQSDNKELTDFMKRGGGQSVTININASSIDARGMDAVLLARAPTIAAAVQKVYNRNGRRGGPMR